MRPLALTALLACDGAGRPTEEPAVPATAVEGSAAEPSLKIGGADALAASLLPALGAAFEHATQLRVEVTSSGSEAAIDQLLSKEIDLAGPCRDATPSEDEQAKVDGWSFFGPASRHLVAVDVVALAVHEANRIERLTYDEIIGIFCTGAIKDWSALVGGPPVPIQVLARDPDSGSRELFEDFFCGSQGIHPSVARGDRAGTEKALTDDPGAVAFISVSEAVGRLVPLAPDPDAPPIEPTQANVIRGSYPLYRDVALYSRGAPEGNVARFLEWVASPAGQEVVDEQRFVPLTLRPERMDEPRPLRETVHFDAGATEPNQRSLARIDVLVRDLQDRGLRHVVLEGYTDATEPDALELSRQRAEAVQRLIKEQLASKEIHFEIIPRGPKNPIAPNDTPYGKLRNRRVQVYLGEEETEVEGAIAGADGPAPP
jgi:phosphate transport system substrate-binding protein